MKKFLALCASGCICAQAQYSILPIAQSPLRTGMAATLTYLPFSTSSPAVGWDSAGGFYFATGSRVLHVNQAGTLDRIIGNGFLGSTGDGQLATSAEVSTSPLGLAIDGTGNLYIGESNGTVRKVDAATGLISRYAGGGQSTGSGVGDGGPATSAVLDTFFVGGIAVDSAGNLYIADGRRVRKVSAASNIITTIANTANAFGSSGDGGPALAATFRGNWGVAVDASNNVYLGDTYRIRKITAATGTITTIAGNDTNADSGDNGPASAATLNSPSSLGVDAAGNVYVSTPSRIRKITPQGIITSIAISALTGSYSGDGGPAGNGTISGGGQLTADPTGDLLYTDTANSLVIKIDGASTIMHKVAGTTDGLGDGGPVASAQFSNIAAMTVDSTGNLYLADTGSSRVRRISASSGVVTTVAGNGTHTSTGDQGAATSAGIAGVFASPVAMALAMDSSDNLYIGDAQKIRKVDPNGIISTLAVVGTGGGYIRDMVVDGEQLFLILTPFGSDFSTVRKVDLITGTASTVASINSNTDVPLSLDGNGSGSLYFSQAAKITQIDEQTAVTTAVVNPPACGFGTCPLPDATGAELGDGGPALAARLASPQNIRANQTSGDLFIADTGHARLRVISGVSRTISTIAGDRTTGCLTGSVPAASAKFTGLSRLAVAPDGSLYTYDSACAQLSKLIRTPAYKGYVDTVSCTGVSGWAADQNRPSQSISIKIYDGNALLATVLADQERTDVGALLNDNGTHGFSYIFPPSIRDGNAHAIHLEYESTSSQLPGSPRALTCPSGTNYAGFVDSASCSGGIKGWIADRNRPGIPILVSLFAGSTQISTTSAGQLRSDVGAYLNDDGLHGFSIAIPPAYTAAPGQPLEVRYELSSTVVPGGSVTINCGGSTAAKYAGFIDAASCAGVRGWVADRNRPNTPIVVSLWDGAFMIASTTASSLRSDVGAFLGDDGRHAFSLPIPSVALNGIAHALQIRYETSATQVPGAQANITCASTASYAGWVDSASCSGITGWAADKNRLNTPITVSLWDGATQIFSTTANASRPDVGAVVGDAGLHGFSMSIPGLYLDNVRHNYQIRYEQSNAQLPGSPATLTCAQTAVYTGAVDVMSCSTISGWAADRNAPNTSLDVSVFEGSSLLAIVSASGSRPDVGTFLGDNGLHGFGVSTPPVIKDGAPHTITVFPGNSHTPLYGPQALTCNP